jgi:5-methyltetrahydrofolate--homocysteine methyltransferase
VAANSLIAVPLSLKPDLADAARRWQAFYTGEIIDRPVVCAIAPADGYPPTQPIGYRERVFSDIDAIIDRVLAKAEATFWGGDAIPHWCPTFGPDEIAVFCGAEFRWSNDSGDTNWSVPIVENWAKALPLRLNTAHPLWRRMIALYRRAAERLAGKMLLIAPDLHTNMDLLSGLRGPQRLCTDLLDCPELVDQAMADARAIFRQLWAEVAAAGRMDEWGYCTGWGSLYSTEGAATLQCDFSYMISPAMFRRWVLPALEEEAEIVRHVVYHWDGPGALVHTKDLVASRGLHTLSYVPGDGRGSHLDYLDLLKRVQAGGKAVQVWGTPEQLKLLHRELRPEKTMYCTNAETQTEAEELVEWMTRNT